VSARARLLLLALLLAHFALALQYSLRIPLGEAPDEADHWAYVVHLATERRLPVGGFMTQAKHPPLYHTGAALFAALGEPANNFFRPNPGVNLAPGPAYAPHFFLHGPEEAPPWQGGILAYHLARLWSVSLGMATLAALWALASVAVPGDDVLALASVGVLAFLPAFLFIGGSINNDNAAACFGTLTLWGALALYQSGGSVRRAWWTPLALGLGVLSKVSVAALALVAGLGLLLGLLRAGRAHVLRRLIAGALWLYVPALLIVLPWLGRNLVLYGDPLALAVALERVDLRTGPWTGADTVWLLRGWFLSFCGKFGAVGHIPFPAWVYWALGAASLASLMGLAWDFVRGNWQNVRLPLLLLASGVVAVALVMGGYSLVALGTDQGRLLYPALGAVVLLWVWGLLALPPRRARPWAAALLIACFAALGVYALWGIIVPVAGGG
jgi:hypothetical protein